MSKTKYHQINKNNDAQVSIELAKPFIDPNEKAFDYTSINDYKSIYKYTSPNHLFRSNGFAVDSGLYFV